jgi:hypothetical protein
VSSSELVIFFLCVLAPSRLCVEIAAMRERYCDALLTYTRYVLDERYGYVEDSKSVAYQRFFRAESPNFPARLATKREELLQESRSVASAVFIMSCGQFLTPLCRLLVNP